LEFRQAGLAAKKYGFPSYSLRKRDVCLTGIPHTGSWSCAPYHRGRGLPVEMRMRVIFVFDGMLVPTRAMGMMSV
jgi:hypothetical protein